MDARRLELYDLLKPKLDEEPARKLVLALPAEPEKLVTKDDLAALEQRVDHRLDAFEHKMDARFAQVGERFAQLETVLTRRMIAIMSAWSAIVSIAWGTAIAVLR